MTLKVPYTDNLTTNAKLPGMVTEDMRAIEAHDADDHETFNQEVQDRKDADKDLQAQIDKVNDRLDKLDTEKATHDDVEELRSELLGRIHHIYMGDDHQAIREVILDMKEKGEI